MQDTLCYSQSEGVTLLYLFSVMTFNVPSNHLFQDTKSLKKHEWTINDAFYVKE